VIRGYAACMDKPREIDVLHLGRPHVICCFELQGILVDPGPEVSHRTLVAALEAAGIEPRTILLTHIHLDHAGATGALVRRWPDLQVYVHERGAPHVIDPSKLVASAERIYGDDMPRLWGEIVPVPEDNVHVLAGDDGTAVDGWSWFYAPGHASHHVVYVHEPTRIAFTGDVAGVRIGAGPTVPPTPPPDIDLELWRASLAELEARKPAALACTHFGAFTDVAHQLAEIRDGLRKWGDLARETDADEYTRTVQDALRSSVPDPATREAYLQANPPETLWAGLDRYWQKAGTLRPR
jgi:glyoxylase-like metal-dependent hydrolase (beta-lactamase superfamily II)